MDIKLGEWLGNMNVYLKGMYLSLALMAISILNKGLFADYIFLSIAYFWIGYILNFKYCEKYKKNGHGILEIFLLVLYFLIFGILLYIHTKSTLCV